MAEVEVTDRKEVRVLDCRLSKKEFIVRSTEFAQLDKDLEAVESEKKIAMDDFKDRTGGINARRLVLRRQLLTRMEKRDVQCTWHADWASKSMLLRRDDTGDVVEARTMTVDEYQLGFDLTDEEKRLPPGDDINPIDGLND